MKTAKMRMMSKVFSLAVLATFGFVTSVPLANAAGTSSSTNGCYAQWWNTAAAGKCVPAAANGRVSLWVDQVQQTDYSGAFKKVTKNNSYNPFDSNEARFGVRSADVNWRS